jgi:2-polyprenyl-6-methoxyphenol hydroxylase-like FAD-dependent oxidoreductase
MTPDLGQGGGMALEDAATLTRLLSGIAATGAGDARTGAAPDAALDAALDEYDRLRRPRTRRIARQARAMGAVAQIRGRTAGLLRDTALRLVPPALTARQLLDIQAWQPPPGPGSAGGPERQ